MDEETVEDNESIKEKREISSYGISINTSEMTPVNISQGNENELYELGISAYEQDQFEKQVIQQVDSQIAQAEINFKRNVTKKDIGNLEQEIRDVEKELDSIQEIFTSANDGDPSNTKRVSFSLLQRKQSKETLLKQLQNKLNETQSHLDELENNPEAHVLGASSEQQNDLIKFGEITPFDAMRLKRQEQSIPMSLQGIQPQSTVTITSKAAHSNSNNNLKTFGDGPGSDKETKLQEKRPTTTIQQQPHQYQQQKQQQYMSSNDAETTKSPKSITSFVKSKPKKQKEDSDEDYVPEIFSTDDDDEFSDESHEKLPGKQRKSKKNTIKKSKPRQKKEARKKIIDDGDYNSFRDRIKSLKVKSKLKAACKNGEVVEDFDPSLFSDTTDEEDPDVIVEGDFKLKKKIWNKLYKYQRVGVKWLWQLHQQQVGGIIGDEMGLGKTIQVIAFLRGLHERKEASDSNQRSKRLGPILIVCPGTVLQQWVAEFHKWAPNLRVAILHDCGSFVGRKATLVKAINTEPGVLLTTYAGVRLTKEELYRYYWLYVILDEGHKIRNPDSDVTLAVKQFDTPHRLILTGTPMQNSLKELWSLFDFVYPGRLGTLPVFMAEFSVPITMGGYANASAIQVQTAHRCASVLRDTISPYMMRRLKKDVKMVVELPQKSEQVLFCKLSEEQKILYKEYINSSDVASMLTGRLKIFPGLIKLRKICNHPDLVFLDTIKKDETSDESDEDGIRRKNGKRNKKKKEDLGPTKKKKIKYDFQPSQYELEGGYGFWKRAGKMLVVESLLRMWKEKGHRVLLFTQSKQMLNILETFVKFVGYSYFRMDGETNIGSRQTIVKNFNDDKSIFVFLLTTRVGGLGLNLIGADRIIIYDPDWNPSTDCQARERSWRIGQDKNVTIYRLMSTGTIEEKIYHRQIFKQFLTNRVLSNPFQRRFFKSNDLYELFSLDDIGPRQTTETGALFAGTGSEITLRKTMKKSKRNSSTNKSNHLSTDRSEKSDVEINTTENKNRNPQSIIAKESTNPGLRQRIISNGHISATIDTHNKPETPAHASKTLSSTCNISQTSPHVTSRRSTPTGNIPKQHLPSSKKKKKKKKKSKKSTPVEIDGKVVESVEKMEAYRQKQNDEEETGHSEKRNENDVLLCLFQSSGLHSALKHDRIEQASNPDYILVEKEAERVAKQAIDALRKSRAQCRLNGFSVPTWTGSGNSGSNSSNNSTNNSSIPKKRRFGNSTISIANRNETGRSGDSVKDENKEIDNGKSISTAFDLESETLDISSGALLARMRRRNAGLTTNTSTQQIVKTEDPAISEDGMLLKDIEQYMRSRANFVATSEELTDFFKDRIQKGQNALFKELLKQICTFQKKDGLGSWRLKDEFR